ncbi:unnamed protein product [Adineta ricciae]|uniref:ADP ribosyltransferase domain-containing protein n=2 Tax=Adineta ricciae TaxID=249248 RepID=A0A815RE94_ADIRI|nr:unnamed protein product [Adineta ricciae]
MRDIDSIFKFRFFLIDFQKQLEEHYQENAEIQLVYRGQRISVLELTKLQNSIGKSISFNTYLSATLKKEAALVYENDECFILFEIDVSFTSQLKDRRLRPVYVEDQSDFPEESEVIFPIGSTFLIDSIDSIEMKDNQWKIKLKLIDNKNYYEIINSIETNLFEKLSSKLKFPYLLLISGDYEKAERYIDMLMKDSKSPLDLEDEGFIYAFHGQIQYEKGDYQGSLHTFLKALNKIKTKTIYYTTICIHLSYLYIDEGKYNIAFRYLNQALKYEKEIDFLESVDLNDAFGGIYTQMKEFDKALEYFNQSLEKRQLNLSTYPHCYMTFFFIGLVYFRKGEFTEAIQYFQKSLNYAVKILPKTHPRLILIYTIIGLNYSQMKKLPLSLTYLQKAFDLLETNKQNKQNFNPLRYLIVCNAFVIVYNIPLDTTKSFYYAYESYKVYKEYEKFIPKNSLIIKTIFSNLGEIYQCRHDFTRALEFYSNALNFSKEINDRVLITSKIGKVYLSQGNAQMALDKLNQSFKLFKKNRTYINQDTIYWLYSYFSDIYIHKNDFEKARFFSKEALKLELIKTNRNYIRIVNCYEQMIHSCHEQNQNYIDEIINILSKQNESNDLKIHFYAFIAKYYMLKKDYTKVFYYYDLSLKYQLMCFPHCYQQLLHTYYLLGEAYIWINGEDSDVPLSYFEKSRDMYLKLLNLDNIPLNDIQRSIYGEGYLIDNIEESSTISFDIISVYLSISKYKVLKGNYDEALNNIQQVEHIINRYKGKKEKLIKDLLYFRIAFAYKSIKDYNKSILYFEKHLSHISNDYNQYGLNYFLIAQLYYEKKDYVMAISKSKIALTFLYNSKSIDHEKLGSCYKVLCLSYLALHNGNYAFIYAEKSIQHFLSCIPVQYDFVIASYNDATLALQTSKPWNFNESLNYILTAMIFIQYDLSDYALRNLYCCIGYNFSLNGEYNNALIMYKKSLEYCKEPDDIIYSYEQLWLTYIANGEFDEAYALVKKTIDYQINLKSIDFIKLSTSYINMGSVYEHFGNDKLALICYQTVYNILQKYQNDRTHENYDFIYIYIARIYLKYGQLIDALKFCLKSQSIGAFKNKSRSVRVHIYINLGLVQCKLKNYYESLNYFGQAWELIFNENLHLHRLIVILYNYIGYVYFKLDQIEIAMKNYFKCLSQYKDCLQHPDLGEIYKNIGLIYEEKEKNYLLALSYYKQALETVPNDRHMKYILYKSLILILEKKINQNLI